VWFQLRLSSVIKYFSVASLVAIKILFSAASEVAVAKKFQVGSVPASRLFQLEIWLQPRLSPDASVVDTENISSCNCG
jgi:hypothetical protein